MRDRLESLLTGLGLSDKEAKVYLANLTLGPATAQAIAAKATVNRPTTYVMIESLQNQGIISSHIQGKKRYFKAIEPEKLQLLIDRQTRRLAESATQLKQLLPAFETLLPNLKTSEEGTVAIYEGAQGINYWQDEIKKTTEEIRELVPVTKKPPKITNLETKPKAKIRRICALAEGVDIGSTQNAETRIISLKNSPFEAEVSILVDKVAITSYAMEQKVIVIIGHRIARTLGVLFDAMWDHSHNHEHESNS
jgi:sugar-specific transcriptional regulator TrmB